ncbi:MAG: hypothetical protein DRJ42_21690 [Deltaproteobacteria bacterium]|nr:MAG: hypothetical protein DRJ42_21690 [Deltaproteobacteria bacterium]
MLAFYLTCMMIGGVLVALSAFGAGDQDSDFDFDADVDVDVDVDVDADIDADADADADADHGHDVAAGSAGAGGLAELLPIASLRFWTFFLAFGGLLGTLLTLVGHVGPVAIAALSIAVGYLTGFGVTAAVRHLKREKVTSTVSTNDCIGASGRVLLPISSDAAGQIRVEVKGRLVDFIAETDEASDFAIDDEVLVYDVREDGVALISSPN